MCYNVENRSNAKRSKIMNMKFKTPGALICREWTLTEEEIIAGNKNIPLDSVREVKHYPLKNGKASFSKKNGVIQLYYGASFSLVTLPYSPEQNDDGIKAVEYIMSFVGGEEVKKAIEKRHEIQEKGFRKRCAICGKIICYTLEDLEENKRRANSAKWSSIGGIMGALSGNYAASATNTQTAEDQIGRVVDYSKCPSCGSRDLVDITDEEFARIKAQQNGGSTISSADELKKFKELLDDGIITQEEFEAKKKQLLGL